MSILINILLGVFVVVALLMVLVILMQRPKSEGLGAAFGGGVTENIFGAQTTNVLTKITGWLAAFFFILTFALSMLHAHQTNQSGRLRQQLEKADTSAATVPGPAAATTAPASTPGAAASPAPALAEKAAPSAKPLAPAADKAVTPLKAPAPAPAASSKPSP